MTDREAFAWAIGTLVDGADILPTIKTVELMREAARLIAWSGALPHRCDNAARLFRKMIAQEAGGAPLPVTEEMVTAYHNEIERDAAQKRKRAA